MKLGPQLVQVQNFQSELNNAAWQWMRCLAVDAIHCLGQNDFYMTSCEKNNVENKNAKIYQCGLYEISFTRSCNLLRHMRSQHYLTNSFCFFFCPAYFGPLASLAGHQELHHSDLPCTFVSFNNVRDLIDFSTEAMNSKFQIHQLKSEGCRVLEPSTTLFLKENEFLSFRW